LASRSMELKTCHQTLSTVLAFLTPLENSAIVAMAEPPKYDDVTFFDDLLSPRQRRMRARYTEVGQRNEKKEDEGAALAESC
jgi:hypothetical protein